MGMKTVLLPSGNVKPEAWAIKNCPSYYDNFPRVIIKEQPANINGKNVILLREQFYHEYYFNDEADAAFFAMRWL